MLDINTTNGYFIHLTKCALTDTQPLEKPECVSFEEVFTLALSQNSLNLIFYSIEKLNNKPPVDVYNKWSITAAQFLNQAVHQEYELEVLLELLTSNGYEILPLKGSQIKSYYPASDMRTMGDIDILLHCDDTQETRDKIKDIMLSNGYEIDILNDGQVDAYNKPNNINVEIHFSFMHHNHPHYEDFIVNWDKLLKTEKENVFCMTIEDLYYFNIGHFVKNMSTKGNGFRTVVDTFVLWRNMDELQQKKVETKLEQIKLNKVHKTLLKISNIWFLDTFDDGTTREVQEYLINNAVYGSEKNREILKTMIATKNLNAQNSRLMHYISRIFPSKEELFYRFGIKHKSPLLIPFLWLIRIIMLPFKSKDSREKMKAEINTFSTVTNQEVDFFKKVYDDLDIEY